MPERAGPKRERITIQSATETADSEGQPVKSWSTFATAWARAQFLSGRELEGMQKVNAETSLKFVVNYRTDITEKMRVSWRSSFWNINAILPDESKFDMTLLASRVE